MTPDDDILLLLNACHDGELSPGEALAMERRLAADPELKRLAERLQGLSSRVQETLAAPPGASPALRARVIQQVGFRDPTPRRPWLEAWQPLAATLLVGLLAGGVIGSGSVYLAGAPGGPALEDAVVAGHLRGLVAQMPFDIASSSHHVVKPWFNGRTTVAPQVVDLADRGFPLAGGRIDVVGGKPVPTLVYRHDQHVISVTVVPRQRAGQPGSDKRNGYSVDRWVSGDLVYWVVSDLDAGELATFEQLFRAGAAPG